MAYTAAAENLLALAKKLDANQDDTQTRIELGAATDAFNLSIRTKAYLHYRDWADMARIRCASALLSHNVIQNIPAEGYISAKELATKSSTMDEEMIARLMMNLTSQGIIALHPSDAHSYAHTHISQAWLEEGGPEYTIYFIDQLNYADNGKYFHARTTLDANNPLRCPSVWAENAEGSDWFALISSTTQRLAGNDTAMTYGETMLPIFGFYPFQDLPSSIPPDRPLFVDIGGGRGQILRKLNAEFPEFQKHRLILQERPEVLAATTDLPPNVEAIPHDFFQPQPVQGAKVYYLRRILHDWDDEHSIKILSQIVPQMAADSKLLIQEFKLPDRADPGGNLTPFFYDYTMMQVSGRERREGDFRRVFEGAGLELVRCWAGESVAVFEGRRRM